MAGVFYSSWLGTSWSTIDNWDDILWIYLSVDIETFQPEEAPPNGYPRRWLAPISAAQRFAVGA